MTLDEALEISARTNLRLMSQGSNIVLMVVQRRGEPSLWWAKTSLIERANLDGGQPERTVPFGEGQ